MYRRQLRQPERSLDPPDCECGECEDCIALEEAAEEREYWLECRADADRDDHDLRCDLLRDG